MNNTFIFKAEHMYKSFGETKAVKAPAIWIIFAIGGAESLYLQGYSVFGANCRALGSNQKLALEAGVSKPKTEAKAIFVAAIFSAISGLVATCYGAGTNAVVGMESMGMVFPAIIGFNLAKLLEKNINITFGMISGVVTMNVLATGLISLGIPSQLKNTVTGAFLLIPMSANKLIDVRRAVMIRRQASQM